METIAFQRSMGAFRFACGAVLIWAGIRHEQNRFEFFQAIDNYDLVPDWAVLLIAALLPKLEIILGLCLLFRLCSKSAPVVGGTLAAIFGAAMLTAKWRGLSITCGCFGSYELPVTWWHIVGTGLASGLLMLGVAVDSRCGSYPLTNNHHRGRVDLVGVASNGAGD